MTHASQVESPDVVLIGSGIMSATLGAMLKRLDPGLRVQLYEVNEALAQESSCAWSNAGTGHAGICELSYTPTMRADGTVDAAKAIDIFEQFELSRQFWAYAVERGMLGEPDSFLRQVPHVSFVHGAEQVRFLRARYEAMAAHHFFASMEYTEDADQIRRWAPLLIEGRPSMPVAATRMTGGTDVNFGAIATGLVEWLAGQPGCGVATGTRVTGLRPTADGWRVTVQGPRGARDVEAGYVFVGAGGATLSLLQKSGIDEARGYGGFPVGGQWLVCDNPEVVERHNAKVYGQAQAEAPTMAVPHLDRREIDGERALLFGPFAAWTTKFLEQRGSFWDLPGSMRLGNLRTLLKTGASNLPLVRYLVQEGLQSKAARMRLLRAFYPEAHDDDWRVQKAGIRVQAIRDTAGIVHYGTEVITDHRKRLSALLGASPGASVSAAIMMDVLQSTLPHLIENNHDEFNRMAPTHGVDLGEPEMAARYASLSESASRVLRL